MDKIRKQYSEDQIESSSESEKSSSDPDSQDSQMVTPKAQAKVETNAQSFDVQRVEESGTITEFSEKSHSHINEMNPQQELRQNTQVVAQNPTNEKIQHIGDLTKETKIEHVVDKRVTSQDQDAAILFGQPQAPQIKQSPEKNREQLLTVPDDLPQVHQDAKGSPQKKQTAQETTRVLSMQEQLMLAVFNKAIKSNVQKLLQDNDPKKTGLLNYRETKPDILYTLEEIYNETITMTSHEFDRFMKVFDREGKGTFDRQRLIDFFKEAPDWINEQRRNPPPAQIEVDVVNTQSDQSEGSAKTPKTPSVTLEQEVLIEKIQQCTNVPTAVYEDVRDDGDDWAVSVYEEYENPEPEMQELPEVQEQQMELVEQPQVQRQEIVQGQPQVQEQPSIPQVQQVPQVIDRRFKDTFYEDEQPEVIQSAPIGEDHLMQEEEVVYEPVKAEELVEAVEEKVREKEIVVEREKEEPVRYEEVQREIIQEKIKEEVVFEEIKADYKPVPKDPVIAEVEQIFEENKEEGIQNSNSQDNDFPEDDEAINPELFTEHVPLVGRIPIMFFLPNVQESQMLKHRIELRGGRVVEQHECNTYQVRTRTEKGVDPTDFYQGKIYDQAWIEDCIVTDQILPRKDYLVINNDNPRARKLNIGKKKRYTVMEGIKLYQVMGAKKNHKVGIDMWKAIAAQKIIPERSADSLKAFWKKYSQRQLEEYLVESIFFKTDFCLSFKEFPNEDFVDRFKEQYREQFAILAEQHDMEAPVPKDEIVDDELLPINDDDEQFPDELDEAYQLPSKTLFDADQGDDEINDQPKKVELSPETQQIPLAQFSTAQTEKNIVPTDSSLTQENMAIDNGKNQLNEFSMDQVHSKQGNNDTLSHLIGEETKVDQLRPQKKESIESQLKLKPVKKLTGIKRSYNMYSNADSLVYNRDSRPFSTLERLGERAKIRRHKDIIFQEKDVPQYDPQLFQKQMDLEIMTITINERSYTDNGRIIPNQYRKVVRRPDQDGIFRRLQEELHALAKQYSLEFDEIQELYIKAQCNKQKLKEILNGKNYTTWTELDDLCLQKGETRSREYRVLLKEKGVDAIEKRKIYLAQVAV